MSKLREKFMEAWKLYGLGRIPEQEFRFHPTRMFRFDFAWPGVKLAVELDGFGGGHQTHFKFSRDHEKDNLAVEHGWTVLRYTQRQLGSKAKQAAACDQILRVITMLRDRHEL